MNGAKSSLLPKSRIKTAMKVRDELDGLIETARILGNAPLMGSLRRSEQDIKSGKLTKATSRKDLDRFFRG